jgi:hypothetical protein
MEEKPSSKWRRMSEEKEEKAKPSRSFRAKVHCQKIN